MAIPHALSEADIQTVRTAIAIAHDTVWGVLSTVDRIGRPRNRVVHPVWEFDGKRALGWLTTRKTPVKSAHLAANPYVSLAYLGKGTDFAYFDCTAEWVDDAAGKQACWDAFLNAPEPVRYDPASIWKDGPGAESFAVLRFAPYRVQAARAEGIAKGERAGLVRLE